MFVDFVHRNGGWTNNHAKEELQNQLGGHNQGRGLSDTSWERPKGNNNNYKHMCGNEVSTMPATSARKSQ